MASKEEELNPEGIEVTIGFDPESDTPYYQPLSERAYVARRREKVRTFTLITLLTTTVATHVSLLVLVASGAMTSDEATASATLLLPLTVMSLVAIGFYYRGNDS